MTLFAGVWVVACAALLTACDGSLCSQLDSTAHCGACGASCGPDQLCEAAGCACEVGSMCNGECVEPSSDPAHCGACDTPCLPDEDCETGQCVFNGVVCGTARCPDEEMMGYQLVGCCAEGNVCGLDLSPVRAFLDPQPQTDCLALDAPGTLDPSCRSGSISTGPGGLTFGPFDGCCTEQGLCGGYITEPFTFGCHAPVDAPPCGGP